MELDNLSESEAQARDAMRTVAETEGDARRTRIAHQHYVYFDVRTGTWGERGDLKVLSLWDDDLERWQAMSLKERRAYAKDVRRYFGDINHARGAVPEVHDLSE